MLLHKAHSFLWESETREGIHFSWRWLKQKKTSRNTHGRERVSRSKEGLNADWKFSKMKTEMCVKRGNSGIKRDLQDSFRGRGG